MSFHRLTRASSPRTAFRRLSDLLGLRRPRPKQRTALDRRRYDDGVSLGKSPTLRDIERLARKAGFRALLNLNTEGEPGQILSPNVEATWAHAFGMRHERVSIDPGVLRSQGVDGFLRALYDIDRPVYVHSLSGRRAAALMTIHLGVERRLSGAEAVAEAKALGIDCELERLRRFAASEVDRRAREGSPAEAESPGRGAAAARTELEDGPPAVPDRVIPKAS